MDYTLLFCLGGYLAGYSSLLILPFAIGCLSIPRKWAAVHYFTFHAELLPHTEQVVFHKVGFFGRIRRVFVDIKNLEKIQAEVVPANILWTINMFDSQMVFRDMETKEIFVFDANGTWNKDTLEHKLIN